MYAYAESTPYEFEQEILESIQEAPELIEDLVVSPQSRNMISPWALGPLIFGLTFFIEEVAIASSAYFIGADRLPYLLGLLWLYAGIFFSDLFLYGIGSFVQSRSWVRGYIDINDYQKKVQGTMSRGLWAAIIIARVVPGMLIPIFLIMGFTKFNIRKIIAVNLVVTAIYSVLALHLLLYMGLKVYDFMGVRSFVILTLLFLIFFWRKELIDAIIIRYYLFLSPKTTPWNTNTHKGMPQLYAPRHLTLSEKIPYSFIYIPIYLSYFLNALRYRSFSAPLAANPGIENSGICGESKSKILDLLSVKYSGFLPKHLTFVVSTKLEIEDLFIKMTNANLTFPVIAKPDIGYMSRGVELLDNENSLKNYIARFPENQSVVLQEFLAMDGEAGIYYACSPSNPSAKEVRVVLTYFPFLIGDGNRSIKQLLQGDSRFAYYSESFDFENEDYVPVAQEIVRLKISGSTHDGSIHQNLSLPPKCPLISVISEISESVPEFWIGRYDVKFSDLDSLINGKFKIIELNGAAGEDLTAWDPRNNIFQTYKILYRQFRKIFEIGHENQKRGLKGVSGSNLLKAYIEQESLLVRLASAKIKRLKK